MCSMATAEDIGALSQSCQHPVENTALASREVSGLRAEAAQHRSRKHRENERIVVDQGDLVLQQWSFDASESLLETGTMHKERGAPNIYDLFRFVSLHNVHLGTSKLVKECMLMYLSLDIL